MLSPAKLKKANSTVDWCKCDIFDCFMSLLLRCMANVCVGITQQVITVSDAIVSIMTNHGDQQAA